MHSKVQASCSAEQQRQLILRFRLAMAALNASGTDSFSPGVVFDKMIVLFGDDYAPPETNLLSGLCEAETQHLRENANKELNDDDDPILQRAAQPESFIRNLSESFELVRRRHGEPLKTETIMRAFNQLTDQRWDTENKQQHEVFDGDLERVRVFCSAEQRQLVLRFRLAMAALHASCPNSFSHRTLCAKIIVLFGEDYVPLGRTNTPVALTEAKRQHFRADANKELSDPIKQKAAQPENEFMQDLHEAFIQTRRNGSSHVNTETIMQAFNQLRDQRWDIENKEQHTVFDLALRELTD